MRGEFDLIARYFAPLAEGAAGAFGLSDDAAVLPCAAADELVTTLDTLISGVHFRPDDPPDRVARKALRVNLSDLAAMGARPVGYLLSTALSRSTSEDWIASFAEGLKEDQQTFGVALYGGDTTAGPGPIALSVTAFGTVPHGRALRRSGACEGDGIFVSGTIGDAALGLDLLFGTRQAATGADHEVLTERYLLPRPRVELGQALMAEGLATAAIDVSDGLVADLGHVCTASGLGARVAVAQVPLTGAVQRLAETATDVQARALTGGDDYELLFTAPAGRERHVAAVAESLDLPLTRIGVMTAEKGVDLRDPDGERFEIDGAGWTHF